MQVLTLHKWGKRERIARLGHTGTRALATRGCAPPVQALLKVIGAESITNQALKRHKGIENRAAQYSRIHILRTGSRCSSDLNVCVFAGSSTVTLRCAQIHSKGLV